MKQFTVKINVEDVPKLRDVIKRIEPTDGSSLHALYKQLSDAVTKNEEERKRLICIRDTNMMFYINALFEDKFIDSVYTQSDKVWLADNLIRIHNHYLKWCWGEE